MWQATGRARERQTRLASAFRLRACFRVIFGRINVLMGMELRRSRPCPPSILRKGQGGKEAREVARGADYRSSGGALSFLRRLLLLICLRYRLHAVPLRHSQRGLRCGFARGLVLKN